LPWLGNNEIALTLDGIPAAMLVTSNSPGVSASQQAGFRFYNGSPEKLTVTTLDVDGYTIVGPGSPVYTGSMLSQSGGGWSITTPPSTAPNTLTVQPPDVDQAAGLIKITASFTDGGDNCNSNAACATSR
jgi:hypothetical protein